ncbi:bifunctional phosphoribosylaminoimidazolecarboxamide formyltransferase/IMP cyclohydrolase [Stieleria sp. TO1_6]|uniref:bifunctional phosphoribosylaminoimidazolecarboxamide formyltransferase/IMP cyclohydrolase n=1 Tax=Stieleria tagensis TaxID=2956795 RepID=UPI00209BA5FF|nr:bifunctional phosphoribosylaminoimidazolecarboxamide formyltransferase/IMP cyclohydrolase [Stieleria tagensis]MCO8120385.1 bifunctional phosphoribosylaminoimidazolecarboxamide formyltransferase/IMP cyclohydrolase [Stieleria tagensis]
MSNVASIRNALISVSDKLGLADLAAGLQRAGVTIYSTGGTRRHLEQSGVDVLDVADYTGFPEMLDGRVKTLHPKVFGGILAIRDRQDHMDAIDEHDIVPFDLVIVNLYPFAATAARSGVSFQECVEQIDIGGPSLVRAAAKNHNDVAVATSPEQYGELLEQLDSTGGTTPEFRKQLAADAFDHTAAYDRAIADYMRGDSLAGEFPASMHLALRRKTQLRYGENPHQRAALYVDPTVRSANLVSARQISGKELSYNNLLDLDSALEIVRGMSRPAVSVIKHNNPCGAATDQKLVDACRKALAGDPLSAFGSVLGFNKTVDVATAELLCEPGLFIEAIVAPDFEAGAVGLLTTRPRWRENVRLMQVGILDDPPPAIQRRFISGGMLVQETDRMTSPRAQWVTATDTKVDEELWDDIVFGWEMVRHVKSNAIVLAADTSLVGVGAGQMSRVDSVEISIEKAGDRAKGAILASDAFFPFPDSIQAAAEAGIVAVIQPGGSRRDDEVIEACDNYEIPMILTGRRHFKH